MDDGIRMTDIEEGSGIFKRWKEKFSFDQEIQAKSISDIISGCCHQTQQQRNISHIVSLRSVATSSAISAIRKSIINVMDKRNFSFLQINYENICLISGRIIEMALHTKAERTHQPYDSIRVFRLLLALTGGVGH